jgi:ATP-dependent protease ClpP protease subunit
MLKILEVSDKKMNKDILYESWLKESYNLFSKFSDDDFFSDKVYHIYFYSGINNDSVNSLQKLLMDASKTKMDDSGLITSPKPICIHLNSPGGSVDSTDIFYTIIQTQRVPLCVIIENLCASAATDIALLAPYRVMIDYSQYLIHDGFGINWGKKSNLVKTNIPTIHTMIYYNELLKKRTKLSDNEIRNFLERDILIDSNYCLKKNIIDRILKFPKINNTSYYNKFPNLQLNLSVFLKKTNLNHIYIDQTIYDNYDTIISGNNFSGNLQDLKSMNDLSIALDNSLLIKKNNIKSLILHFKSTSYGNSDPLKLVQLNYRLAMIQKRIPIIAFIEGNQSFDTLSTIMMCPIRIMMKPSIFKSDFTFKYSSIGWGFKTIDVIDNSLFIFNNIVKFYKKNTNFPSNIYKEMRIKIINLRSEDLLKYKIIHLCLNMHQKKITKNNIIEYLQLNNLTGLNKNSNNKKKRNLDIK